MHQLRFRLIETPLEELTALPGPLIVGSNGPTSTGMEESEGKEGKGEVV